MTMRRFILPALSTATVLALAACGGGDAATTEADSPSSTSTDGGCRTALEVTYPDGSTVSLDRAQAVELADGGAFTVYAGDYDIPTDDLATGTVTPPAGSHQANIYLTRIGALTDAEPITAGTTVDYTTDPDVLTFSTVLLGDDGMSNQAVDGTGTVTVESVDAESICVDVDYTDDEKSIVGSIQAPVTQSPF